MKLGFLIVGLFAITKAFGETSSPSLSPVVEIETGKLQGKVSRTRDGRDFYEYKGIPYGKAKRFELAEAPEPWQGIRDATKLGSICLQSGWGTGASQGSEDCLFLNVATPRVLSDEPMPTIVYFHGGGFQGGSGAQSGPEYWMDEDVVIVNFNYRLGPYGFLNTDDGLFEGNLGLKDQLQALKWIKRNIERFGGSKEDVTIFGGSAGSASVAFHILSPASKGLFTRAISGSGTSLCPWAFDPNPGKNAGKLAEQVGCPMTGKEMLECLKSKPPGDLVGKKYGLPDWPLDPTGPFVPSLEVSPRQSFLLAAPETILSRGNFNRVPWLLGVTSQEGLALQSAMVMNNTTLIQLLNEGWLRIAPVTLTLGDTFPEGTLSQIRSFYFGFQPLQKDDFTSQKLQQLYSDRNFFSGVRKAAKYHSKSAPTFLYMFDYMDPGAKSWIETVLGIKVSGVAHGDDFAYYFKFYMNPEDPSTGIRTESQTAKEMCRKLIKTLVSLAKSGVPDTEESLGSSWPPVNSAVKTLEWFHIDKVSESREEAGDFKDRMIFWENLEKAALYSNGGVFSINKEKCVTFGVLTLTAFALLKGFHFL